MLFKIKKLINNNLLPISYNLWKLDLDEIYLKLKKEDLKLRYLSTKIELYSKLILPLFILLLTVLFTVLTKSPSIFIVIPTIYFICVVSLLNHHHEKYTNKKYQELTLTKESTKKEVKNVKRK